MQTLTIGSSQYTLNPTRDVGALQDKFSKCTGKPKKPSLARARREYPVFEAGMSTAAYVSLFEDMNGKHLTPSKAYFAPLNKDACTLYSGADVHELIDDLSDDAGDPVPVILAPVQAIPAPAAPVAVPMLSRMVDDGASAEAMARAVFSRAAQQTPIQYLPLWARIAIERLDADSELRTSSALSDLLDAYACTYGQTCDDDTRASALHICARRFPGFDAVPVSTVRHVSPEEFDAMAAALQARAAPEAAACEAIRAPGTLAAKLARADVARAQAPRTREFESPLPVHSAPGQSDPFDPFAHRPMAARGLTSYRARGRYGWIMIGASDPADAMREARRSTDEPTDLQVWDGGAYVPCAAPPTGELNAAPATPIRALRGAEPHQQVKPHPSSRTHATARADPPLRIPASPQVSPIPGPGFRRFPNLPGDLRGRIPARFAPCYVLQA